MLEVAQDLLCAIDEAGTLRWANAAWERDLGFAPSELPGRPLLDLAHPDDRERLALELMTVIGREGGGHGFTCRMLLRGGGHRWICWSALALPEGGHALGGRDVTALRAPGDRDALVNVALDAIISVDRGGRVIEFNPSAEQIFGFRREEALGRSLAELIIPEALRARHEAGIQRVADGRPGPLMGRRLELPAVRADGSTLTVELTITRPDPATGVTTAFIRDITARLDTEKELLASEERLAQVFDLAPVGMALVSIESDSAGRLLRVNAALIAMLGHSEAALLATDFQHLTHPDDLAQNLGLLDEVQAGHSDRYELEKRFLRADGSWIWAHVHAAVVRDADGRPVYGISQVQDVTERRRSAEALHASRASLARTQALARIGSWEYDLATDRFTWSSGVEHVFGVCEDRQPAGVRTLLDTIHDDDRARVQAAFARALEGDGGQTWEYRARTVSGEVADLHAWGEVVRGDDGAITALAGYLQDISSLRRAEHEAAGLRKENLEILAAAGDGIFRVDRDGRITFANPAAEQMFGFGADELLGRRLHSLVHHSRPDGSPYPWEACPVQRSLARGDSVRVADDLYWHKDGSPVPVAFTTAPIRRDREVTGAVVVVSDVGERRRLEQQLRAQAERDDLTGLHNRRRFEELIAERLERDGGEAALLLLDLDHFKFVNDCFGHAVGDDLIRAVAGVLAEHARADDVLCRLGGDEFGLLLPDAAPEAARAVADRLIAGIERARPVGVQMSASVGVTCFSGGQGGTAGDLLVAADIALYEAKDAGRARASVYAGRAGASLTWVERIRAALREDRLTLYAQPIVDLATGKAVHEELLVRMLDEDGAVVPPGSFLPTAESFGLIGDIDRWVLRRGVEVAATGRHVHVNLSGHSVGRTEVLDELAESLAVTGADPAHLVIELTETMAVANLAGARAFARRLREIGCGLALDDFGTGFGSFTYLKHLPADFLKLDQEFIRDLTRSDADRRVVDAIVGIAARFGMQTIAEGVEDEATLAVLRDAGVDFVQGYHLGRPAPIA
jgi:diguanylate cyclase (GGDEF)-like protein/PAS domain S-box-containing protein